MWLRRHYKHDENKPPELLEGFRAYVLTYDAQLENSHFKKLYDRLSASEGLIRCLGVLVTLSLASVPEPFASPLNLICETVTLFTVF